MFTNRLSGGTINLRIEDLHEISFVARCVEGFVEVRDLADVHQLKDGERDLVDLVRVVFLHGVKRSSLNWMVNETREFAKRSRHLLDIVVFFTYAVFGVFDLFNLPFAV